MPLPQPAFVDAHQQDHTEPSAFDTPGRQQPSTMALVRTPVPPADRKYSAGAFDWRFQTEIKVRFTSAPSHVTTKAIWNAFQREGNIVYIELYQDGNGKLDGSGTVRFCPPPSHDFWKQGRFAASFPPDAHVHTLRLKLLQPEPRKFRAPLNGRIYPEKIVVPAKSLTFGYMHGPMAMQTMYTVNAIQNAQIKVVQDLNYRTIDIHFPLQTNAQKASSYRIRLSHASKLVIFQPSSLIPPHRKRIVMSLDTPPELAIKQDGSATHQKEARRWGENDQWYRHGNIMAANSDIRDPSTSPTSLNVSDAAINIGRWTTYSLEISEHEPKAFDWFCDALRDFNIPVRQAPTFEYSGEVVQPVWTVIDRPILTEQAHSDSLAELMDHTATPLDFEVRYQLEVCISEGRLNEYTISRSFVERLRKLERTMAIDLLESVSAHETRFYDPMAIFNLKELQRKKSKKNRLPNYCTIVRSAVVTPSTIYFSSPTIEISNRVVRQYTNHSNHFLRVRFSDEKPKGRLYAARNNTMTHVYQRIKETLTNGISIGDRHYEFLAFGNSQLREHGAYFYNPIPHVTTDRIRAWMGDFEDIPQVAKYAARLGQCFSTTRAIHGARAQLEELPDVMSANGKYNFTDGVGRISKALAALAATEMGTVTHDGEPPSVLQFRLGGCKGVLAVWPQRNEYLRIHVRPSQYKFHAQYEGLEVIRWSQLSAAHLNQQIIAVLSTLGVKDEIFIQEMRSQLSSLAEAMGNEKTALGMLQKEVDHNQQSLVLAAMVSDGFQSARDPFMMSVLKLWRAWNIKYLKEKAKIVVSQGAVLLGCTDEAQVLKGHFDRLQPSSTSPSERELFKSTPEVFVQLSKGVNDKPQVVEGFMLLARNPSLHPGDIRVVRGVNKPELRHLRDVVVLPQTGDRDIASMCSGGDLDGDDYVVIWNRDLLPRTWNHPPMDFTPPPSVKKRSGVTIDDITSFFVEYMKNDSLPAIACAHRAQADYSDEGVMSPKCIELARLHSQAVDFPKSGQSAKMNQALQPRKFPHWMGRRPEKSYKSSKVLGKLYDEVELVDFEPDYSPAFDSRILSRSQDLGGHVLSTVGEIKQRYDDAVRRIMSQHAIKTEFEVWSTFVIEHIKRDSEYKFHETIGQLSTALKEAFRDECIERAGGRDMAKLGPFVTAMYFVTHEEVALANERWKRQRCSASDAQARGETMPMMSFPWLFPTILGRLAVGELDKDTLDTTISTAEPSRDTSKQALAHKQLTPVDDALQTEEGVTHRGQVLEMFTGKTPHQISNTGKLIDFGNDEAPIPPNSAAENGTAGSAARCLPIRSGQPGMGQKPEGEDRLQDLEQNAGQEDVARRDLPQRKTGRLWHGLSKMHD